MVPRQGERQVYLGMGLELWQGLHMATAIGMGRENGMAPHLYINVDSK